jgi:hypothetical protein
MKRIFSLILCLLLVAVWAVPVSAADPEIIFTDESFYHPGFTMEVDEGETLMSCYHSISDIYNAYLEGFVEYTWFRDGVPFMEGGSMYITESHRGHTFYLAADLYSNAELTDFVCTIYSQSFTVPGAEKPTIPEITTKQLPNAVVGQEYYFQLECTNPDVTYSLFRSSLPDGMYLTQHGEIEGTPTKAGMWYVVIMATPEAGEDYATTAQYEFYVVEDGPDYTIEILQLPKKLTYYQGEKLDMTGLKVRIWTPDGYIDSKDGKYLTYYQGTLDNLGERRINLKYEDAQEPIYVTVIEAPKPTETQPPATEPPATTVPPTTEAPSETTVPPTTEAPPETTVPVTEAPPETTEAPTEPVQPEPKPSGAPLALAFVGGGATAGGIGALVYFLMKKRR